VLYSSPPLHLSSPKEEQKAGLLLSADWKMANDWDQSGWYMGDGTSTGGQEGEPTDSLEVFPSRADPSPVPNPSNQPPSSIPLSPMSQTKMSRSIVEIFELEEESMNEDVEMEEDDEEEPVVDLEDRRKRTDRLRGVLPALAQLWWSDSDQIDLVAEKLGDGSRDRKLFPIINTIFITFKAGTVFSGLGVE
jgi:hypothetical protein